MDPRRPRWPHPVWLALFVLAAAAAALSAGREPLDRALVGLVRPADFARDFVAAEDWIAGNPVYGEWPGRLERHAALLGIDSRIRGPFFAHHPSALLLVAPLVPLGFRAAAFVWAGLSIGLLVILAGVLADALPIRRPTLAAGLLLVALVSWPPVLYNLEKGQWSIALATLIALTWRDLGHGRERRAGVCLGIASLVKLTPLLFLLYLVVVRRRRTAVACLATVAFAATIPTVLLGPAIWTAFTERARWAATFWETWLSNTLSLDALPARTLDGGPGMAPLGHWPWAARVVTGLAAAGLGWTALSLTRETGGRRAPSLDGALFALWAVLVVVLNPLAWSHYAIMLVLPALLILAMAADPGVSLTTGARRVVFAMVGAALTLLSVPKETLFRHIAPVPVTPVRSAGFLALHFDGALLLFAAAAYLARPRRSGSLAVGRRGKEPALAGGGASTSCDRIGRERARADSERPAA